MEKTQETYAGKNSNVAKINLIRILKLIFKWKPDFILQYNGRVDLEAFWRAWAWQA